MILLRIDPAVLTLCVIALLAVTLVVGYLLGLQDARDDIFEEKT